MKRPNRIRLLSLVSLLLVGAAAAQSQAVATFRLSQAIQVAADPPTLRVYLDVLDAAGEPVSTLDPATLTATLGESATATVGLDALATSSEGVAYIFLVDISKSLSNNEFGRIRTALEGWMSSLGPADRVALISFGEASRLELDFTADVTAASMALEALGPTDDLTVFHLALRDALELASRRDPGLPNRRVLVVLGDGKDEGSGLAAGDLLAALRGEPVPIYAIGLSRLRSPSERRRYLNLLNRFATNSGGAYVEATADNVADSYAAMLAAVRRVWVATFECAACRADGESYRLQVNLADGDRLLTDGRRVRLLPGAAGTEAETADEGSADEETTTTSPDSLAAEPAPGEVAGVGTDARTESDPKTSPWWWLLAAVAGLIAFLFVIWRRRTGEETPHPEPEEPEEEEPPDEVDEVEALPASSETPARVYQTPDGVPTSRPPKPPSLRLVRLIVVRGQRVGRQYSMMLLERGVVGARSTCDCVLVDEPGFEPEQFELLQIDGRVYIRNLARQRPTLRDGLPISDREPLESQTLVGNSETILRVLYDEPRHVPI